MLDGFSVSKFLPDDRATTRLAERVAPILGPGDTLLLDGPIGSGKTHFARGLIQARLAADGRHEDVPSPTYTLVQTYFDGTAEIWHADLYRLAGAHDLAELGLDEAVGTAIVLIEWPDRLGEPPAEALHLRFEVERDGRRVTLSGAASRWHSLAPAFRNDDA